MCRSLLQRLLMSLRETDTIRSSCRLSARGGRIFSIAIRTALTIARPQNCERNAPPNLLAHYPYLWEITVVQQAIETAWISASSGGHSLSYWCQQRRFRKTQSSAFRSV